MYMGDEILPSYIGIIIGHCKDPYLNVNRALNVAQMLSY